MKKIIYLLLFFTSILFVSCDNKTGSNDFNDAIKYIDSLKSYELKADMTIYRHSKEIKIEVEVDYLKPNYYKVSFENSNGSKQYIVKNDEGVFVLTPSLNKEFKFDSQWPLNSSHAYLLEGIVNDISTDNAHTYKVEGTTLIVECKLAIPNHSATKLQFYYDLSSKKPIKAICLNDNNETVTQVVFTEFSPNKSISKDEFNTKLIMAENGNNETNDSSAEQELTLTVGYITEGSSLISSKFNGDLSILCYNGTDLNYTIIVDKANVYQTSVILEEYSMIEYLECGLLVANDNMCKYYNSDYEISVFYNNLSIDELLLIAGEIQFS